MTLDRNAAEGTGTRPTHVSTEPLSLEESDFNSIIDEQDVAVTTGKYGFARSAVLCCQAIDGLTWLETPKVSVPRFLAASSRADMETLVPRMLAWMIADVAAIVSDDAVRAVMSSVSDLHASAATGASPTAEQWRTERRKAMTLADDTPLQSDKMAAELAAASAWPISEATSVLADGFRQWVSFRVLRAQVDSGLAPADRGAIGARHAIAHEAAIKAGASDAEREFYSLMERYYPGDPEIEALRVAEAIDDGARSAAVTAFLEQAEKASAMEGAHLAGSSP